MNQARVNNKISTIYRVNDKLGAYKMSGPSSKPHILGDMQVINPDVIVEVEKDIEICDLVSMVFLLYRSPDVAFERLTNSLRIYENLGEQTEETNFNLLLNWAKENQFNPNWKEEFLEALTICQLYKVLRKLGFEVSLIKELYSPLDVMTNFYVNPMKKVLYRLCEHITEDILQKLKNTLKTYEVTITTENYCELLFLELMCQRFIIVDIKYDVKNLAKIIDNFPHINKFSNDLMEIQKKLNNNLNVSMSSSKLDEKNKENEQDNNKIMSHDLDDVWEKLAKMSLEEISPKNLKSDTNRLVSDMYPIKNPDRVGVCYIINQVDFNPSKSSIENNPKSSHPDLDSRCGSDKDKTELEKTMAFLNFEVICHRNLDHEKMIEHIENIIKYRVFHDHSIFMLCILSHGVEGHVYAADSVLVNVQHIENIVDQGLKKRRLHDMPKVFIIQACQINNENNDEKPYTMATDGPEKYIISKYHRLTCWATSPELEAFRSPIKGSIFIQILCSIIKKYSKYEHMGNILYKVKRWIHLICTNIRKDQVPICIDTLDKKLYLQIPEVYSAT